MTQNLIRRDSELKRYITEKKRLSAGNKEMAAAANGGNLAKSGTILELSEHSVSERLSICNTTNNTSNNTSNNNSNNTSRTIEAGKNLSISEFNPFRFIWTIKSSSYECISKEKRKRKCSL